MRIELVWTGGQTGVDQGAWRAAEAIGIPTGGFMPKGYLTEAPSGYGAESHPELAERFKATAIDQVSWSPRTRANVAKVVAEKGFVLILDATPEDRVSNGTRLAMECLRKAEERAGYEIGFALVKVKALGDGRFAIGPDWSPDRVGRMIAGHVGGRVLFVGGNRESAYPGIGAGACRYVRAVLETAARIKGSPENVKAGR